MLSKVRRHLAGLAGLNPTKVILNATHTHTAPEICCPKADAGNVSTDPGFDLSAMPVQAYVSLAAGRIAEAVQQAWSARSPGTLAYGLGHAVVGRNRRWVDTAGRAAMYGNTDSPDFSHIEGYEDHSVSVLATYTPEDQLTGLTVNVPCQSQVTESAYTVSADYWHETRQKLRLRLGTKLYVLPQCSAAGDQSAHLLFDKRAEVRMRELGGRTEHQEIAHRIANTVQEVLDSIAPMAADVTDLEHRTETQLLPMNALTQAEVCQWLRRGHVLGTGSGGRHCGRREHPKNRRRLLRLRWHGTHLFRARNRADGLRPARVLPTRHHPLPEPLPPHTPERPPRVRSLKLRRPALRPTRAVAL